MKKIDLSQQIIGRFYFKRTQNGNLIGEFSNNVILRTLTESADIIDPLDGFRGKYHTTWQEDGDSIFANLTIGFKDGTGNSIYQLSWTTKDGTLMFLGEGFLVDGILIGDYRDFGII